METDEDFAMVVAIRGSWKATVSKAYHTVCDEAARGGFRRSIRIQYGDTASTTFPDGLSRVLSAKWA